MSLKCLKVIKCKINDVVDLIIVLMIYLHITKSWTFWIFKWVSFPFFISVSDDLTNHVFLKTEPENSFSVHPVPSSNAQWINKLKKKMPEVKSMWILFQVLPHHVVFHYRPCFANLTGLVRWRAIEPLCSESKAAQWEAEITSCLGVSGARKILDHPASPRSWAVPFGISSFSHLLFFGEDNASTFSVSNL